MITDNLTVFHKATYTSWWHGIKFYFSLGGGAWFFDISSDRISGAFMGTPVKSVRFGKVKSALVTPFTHRNGSSIKNE